jgi:AraC-like DNA-binding protein/mannose-6-phosphate isomerase-like protein (cupin superfamily)
MKKQNNIALNFTKKTTTDSSDFSIMTFSGNHWDDIFYFPKNYEIGLIQEGKGVFTVGQTDYVVQKGDTFFIRPNLVHKGKPNPETGWTITCVRFKPEVMDDLMQDGAKFSIFNQLIPQNSMTETLTKLLSHFESEVNLNEAVNLVYAFLLDCSDDIPNHETVPKHHEAILNARLYIDQNFKNKFSLDDLAKEVFMSKFHLLRLFKQEIGLAPYTYQLQLKLNEARKLIFLKKSLTEVAYELGFNDQAHFINTYKKYTEITPSDFLKTAVFHSSKY